MKASDLDRARAAFARRAWADAHAAFAAADRVVPLDLPDLDSLSVAAGLSGNDDALLKALERIHDLSVARGDLLHAARVAFWKGFRLMALGEQGQANGWLARSDHLVEEAGGDCAERGYLLFPVFFRHVAARDFQAAVETAAEAARIGDRFSDADLSAFARNLQGRGLIRQEKVVEGIALLDEAMLAASSGKLSPIITGLLYCSVLEGCRQVYALDRAREWTAALAAWCDAQPQLVAFSGACLVYRAEIMQLEGAWSRAIAEARRAVAREAAAAASGAYQEAEVHRLRGEYREAESAYRRSSRSGSAPQPGLALLRMAEGQLDASVAQIRTAMAGAVDRLPRARLLPAYVEIMLAAGQVGEARRAVEELEGISEYLKVPMLDAIAGHARGALAQAEGRPENALLPLRRAFAVWQKIGAPYLAARIRVLVGQACRSLGDQESAALEWEAARSIFDELGAQPDLARVDELLFGESGRKSGLTARELQVLRLVACGKTNKVIAGELKLSEKTIDRHLSNIFVKIDVPSRAAATAYAYEHKLI